MKLTDCEGKRGKGDLSFVKVPRWVFDWMYSNNDFEQHCGQVYLALIVKSYFSEGKAVLGKAAYYCQRGEWFGSSRYLSDMLRMPYGCVLRALSTLKDNCLVDTRRVKDGTCFKVIAYDEIVKGKKQISNETIVKELTPAEALYAYDRKFGGRNMEFDLPEKN